MKASLFALVIVGVSSHKISALNEYVPAKASIHGDQPLWYTVPASWEPHHVQEDGRTAGKTDDGEDKGESAVVTALQIKDDPSTRFAGKGSLGDMYAGTVVAKAKGFSTNQELLESIMRSDTDLQ